MRSDKKATLARMRQSYAALKAEWGGHAPFDAWFAGDINNAHLASIATYYTCVPGFQRELAAVNADLPAFYRRVKQLAKMDQKTRDLLGVRARDDRLVADNLGASGGGAILAQPVVVFLGA